MRVCKIGLIVAAMVAAVAAAQQARADDDAPMSFRLVRLSSLHVAVYAPGTITTATTPAFNTFIAANKVNPGTTLFFNSPGGDLGASILLGQAIRKAAVDTAVGIPVPGSVVAKPGLCASACTFAFIGGVERTVDSKSSFGVHRFELTTNVKNAEKKSQKIAGLLVDYIGTMSVSQQIYVYSTIQGNDAKDPKKRVLWLDGKTMAQLKIITTDRIKAAIVDVDGTTVLRVHDIDGAYEFGEMDFYCTGKTLLVRGYFARPGRAFDAKMPLTVSWFVAPSLTARATVLAVADRQYRMVPPKSGDQQIEVDVEVAPKTLSAILAAKAMGLKVTGPNSYSGFDAIGAVNSMPSKVQTLLKTIAACPA